MGQNCIGTKYTRMLQSMETTNDCAVISSSNSSCFRLRSRKKSLRTAESIVLTPNEYVHIFVYSAMPAAEVPTLSCNSMRQNCTRTKYTTMLQPMDMTNWCAVISSSNSSCFRLRSRKKSLRTDESFVLLPSENVHTLVYSAIPAAEVPTPTISRP